MKDLYPVYKHTLNTNPLGDLHDAAVSISGKCTSAVFTTATYIDLIQGTAETTKKTYKSKKYAFPGRTLGISTINCTINHQV